MDHGDTLARYIVKHKVRRFAELGVNKGRLIKCLMKQVGSYLSEYWAIDQWKTLDDRKYGRNLSRLTQQDWDARYDSVCKNMVHFSSLRIVRMSSLQAAQLFPLAYFDLVFIDTSHLYEDTKQEILAWKPLVRSGGFLSGHDYGSRKWNGVKKAVDELIPKVKAAPGNIWITQV